MSVPYLRETCSLISRLFSNLLHESVTFPRVLRLINNGWKLFFIPAHPSIGEFNDEIEIPLPFRGPDNFYSCGDCRGDQDRCQRVPVEGNSAQVAVAQAPQATDPPQPTDPPQATNTLQPTVSPFISSQEAIALASARLGSSDLYSIETTKLGGLDVYKVTFSSGNMVYVSPQGHILLVTSLAQIQEQLTAAGGSSGGSSPPRTSSSSSHGDDSGGGDD